MNYYVLTYNLLNQRVKLFEYFITDWAKSDIRNLLWIDYQVTLNNKLLLLQKGIINE